MESPLSQGPHQRVTAFEKNRFCEIVSASERIEGLCRLASKVREHGAPNTSLLRVRQHGEPFLSYISSLFILSYDIHLVDLRYLNGSSCVTTSVTVEQLKRVRPRLYLRGSFIQPRRAWVHLFQHSHVLFHRSRDHSLEFLCDDFFCPRAD